MKIYQTFIISFAALFIFGCGDGNTAATPASVPQIISPTETLKTFIESSKKKDVESVKKTLSKGSLELIEKTAKAQSVTVDELLKRENSQILDDAPEISNEKIENDTATVDVKIKNSSSDAIPFVKEEGVWKIAFDKYQATMMEKMRQDMKMPESNAAKPDSNQKSNAPAKKPAANK